MLKRFISYYKPHKKMLTLDMIAALLISVIGMVYPIVTKEMLDLVSRASAQNFVPVVDDKDAFIGIVTRSNIMKYCFQQLYPDD